MTSVSGSVIVRGFGQFVGRHWRGQHGLVFTVLFSLLALRMALGLLQVETPPRALPLSLTLSLSALWWQVLGGWRCIEAHTRHVGGMALVWAGYGALVVVLAMALVQSLDAFARLGQRDGRLGPINPKPPALLYNNTTRSVVLSGPVRWPQYAAFKRLLESGEPVNRVQLDSEGGLVFAARAVARLVEQHRFDTEVVGRCHSACTLVFLAGKRRALAEGAALGFHQYAMPSHVIPHGYDLAEEHEQDRRFLAKRGVSAAFIEQVFHADHRHLWVPDRAALEAAGVLTIAD